MRLVPALMWGIEGGSNEALDARLVPLLEAIAATGSLAAAVTERRMSYRAAWGMLRDYERALGVPLVQLQRGRGAQLAAVGAQLLHAQRMAEQRLTRILPSLAFDLGVASWRREGAQDATLVVAASHDLALGALRDVLPSTAGLTLALSVMGSLHALQQFAEGHADATGFHVALGARHARDLAPFRRWLSPHRDRLIRFVDREQGLILARGNPTRVRSFADIVRKGLRFVNRQPGSGTRLLIDRIMVEQGLRPEALLGFSHEEFTHQAIAATVAAGGADAGFGLRAAAAERGLAFVPLLNERYYLAVRKSQLDMAAVATLLQWLRSPAFVVLASRFPGYDPADAGTVATIDTLGIS
jgi:molybdate transport repressor ModE-like protein